MGLEVERDLVAGLRGEVEPDELYLADPVLAWISALGS